MIRFVHFFNHAEGMSLDDGEEWYLGKHVPRVRELPGVGKYVSWQAQEDRPGRTTVSPSSTSTATVSPAHDPKELKRFVRRSDLYFETLAEGFKAVLGNPDLWTPSPEGEPGFREFECMFLEEEPQYDLMRDVPVQQYKYMGNPLRFSGAEPEWVDNYENNYDVFFHNYRSPISVADGEEWVVDGEDWFLGHLVREGKIMKQLGKRHFKTWNVLRAPSEPDSPLLPNRWYRLTENGMPAGGPNWANVEEAKVQLTRPEGGIWYSGPAKAGTRRGYGEWMHIIIDPELAQDLLS